MSYQLLFAELIAYDSDQPSITIPVSLSVNRAVVNCDARVDTGSSNCLFALSVGEELGLDIETGMRLLVGTVMGNFVAYLHEVTLSVGSFEFNCFVGFAEENQFRRNVLGRRGFVEQVVVGLVDYEGKLYLKVRGLAERMGNSWRKVRQHWVWAQHNLSVVSPDGTSQAEYLSTR